MLKDQSLFDDIWKLRLYMVASASYDSLVKQNIVNSYWVVKRIDERMDTVYAFLNSRLDEKMTRATLSGLVHLNPNYLDKIFFEKYRMKPMQLLRELRLQKARRMLEASDEPLSGIAVACGLGDAPYLSHQFLKRFGITPGLYREQVRMSHANYYISSMTE